MGAQSGEEMQADIAGCGGKEVDRRYARSKEKEKKGRWGHRKRNGAKRDR